MCDETRVGYDDIRVGYDDIIRIDRVLLQRH
jgi:hypothetical protein